MADPDGSREIHWYAPDPRAVLPIENFHVPTNLRKLMRRHPFRVSSDENVPGVMRACAAPRLDASDTWLSDELVAVYETLATFGFVHSVECYLDGEPAGGLYGVAMGGAFFGESMFHTVSNASKVALVCLMRHLAEKGFLLHDIQFITPHLQRFGAVEIPRSEYERRLEGAIGRPICWEPFAGMAAWNGNGGSAP